MNKLQVFQSGLFEAVRATMINDEPWFVGTDVATALDYHNQSEAISDHVAEDDIMKSSDMSKTGHDLLLINESGVYSLIFHSKQERAKAFKRWVTHDVLPALRRTGQYSMKQTGVELTGDRAVELAKILSTVSPPNLPYVLSALKMAGYNIQPDQKLLGDGSLDRAMQDLTKVRVTSRKYPWDMELITMLCKFSEDNMSMSELGNRAFVLPATLYSIRKGFTNTCPEFAARIKNSIREMYAEKESENQ